MSDAPFAFIAALPPRLAEQARAWPQLTARLEQRLAEARARWPTVACDEPAFLSFLGGKLEPGGALEELLQAVRVPDLWLAYGCGQGNAAALRAFEEAHFDEVGPALARMHERYRRMELDDVKQLLRQRLFLSEDGAPPRVLDYSGAGELRSWFKVALVRTVLNLVTRGHPELPSEEELFLALPSPEADPELQLLKAKYRHEFRAAFTEALAALPAKDRTLLRQWFIDRLGIDELGLLNDVHRATAARWLTAARDALVEQLRRSFAGRLKVSQGELDSILRLIHSQVSITPSGFLRDKP